MSIDDVVTVLEAVGDSWPAAIVIVAVVVGVIAWRALPHLKDLKGVAEDIRHEMTPNSGKSMRDAINRIEQQVTDQGAALDAHIAEAKGRAEADLVWRGQVEDLLTATTPPPTTPGTTT